MFDKIIMNAPFDKNLHLKILREAMRHIEKEGGEVICLHPNRFMKELSVYDKQGGATVITHLKDFEVIDHDTANNMFDTGNQIDELIIGIYDLGNYRKPPFTDIQLSIYHKITNKNKSLGPTGGISKVSNCRDKCGKYYQLYDTWANDIVDDETRKVHYAIPFKSQKEKDNFRYVYKNSFIQKWLNKMHSPRIRVLTCGYEKLWTNEDLYEYFNLTPEEIKEVEKEISK